jgi:hypothetical protein
MPSSCAFSSASAIWRAMGQRLTDRDDSVRDPFIQRGPLNELHHQSDLVVRALETVHVGDVGVIQRGQRPGFTLESSDAVRILCERIGQHLDGHRARQVAIGRFIHLAHAAFANLGGDFVRADAGAVLERHGERRRRL